MRRYGGREVFISEGDRFEPSVPRQRRHPSAKQTPVLDPAEASAHAGPTPGDQLLTGQEDFITRARGHVLAGGEVSAKPLEPLPGCPIGRWSSATVGWRGP